MVGGWMVTDFSVSLCPFLNFETQRHKMDTFLTHRHKTTKWTQSLTTKMFFHKGKDFMSQYSIDYY